ncbi:MAG: two-component system, OmpR family, phosphate regulon sensor histidine kinase PhoR [Bacillota bacterium]|nr:two-component system, OmpR family, phosphate regulon sensor histidine kinase PhoR [Bacillota bacterium]
MLRTIRGRLTLSYALLLFLTVSLMGTFLVGALDHYYLKESTANLEAHARVFTHYAELSFLGNALARRFSQDVDARVQILDVSGTVVGDSRWPEERTIGQTIGGALVKRALSGDVASEVVPATGGRLLHVAAPLKADGNTVGVVYLTSSLASLDRTLTLVRNLLLFGALAALAAALLVGSLLARSITRPLADVTAVARRLAGGDFSLRLTPRPPAEVEELSRAFNYLTERLATSLRAMEAERQKLSTVLASMGDLLLAVDRTGTVVLVNPALARVLETETDALIGRPLPAELLNSELGRVLAAVLDGGWPQVAELTLPGRCAVYRAQVTPWRGGPEEAGAVAVLRDITDLKKLETERLEFLANVSHELRTPLTSIKGFAVTLQDELGSNPEAARYARIIEQETDRLSRLVGEIMDLSRLDAKEISLDLKAIDLTGLISQVVEQFLPRAESAGLLLGADLPPALPRVLCDADRIHQVLVNLLDNAIKYTPVGGSITVIACTRDREVCVGVRDTGVGIPPEDLPHIFDRFYRVDKARSRALGGTGLGLAIVKAIITEHGGKVSVTSRPGEGSEFYFCLPQL